MKNRNTTFTSVILGFTLLGFSPIAVAVSPAPDGGYPGGNTAEGQNALRSLTSGTYNTSVGFLSLFSDTTGAFNTALGAGALLGNFGDSNTATGAGALLNNTVGTENTADGTFALFRNTGGGANTATGIYALFSNTTGDGNTASGFQALAGNQTGKYNTANGFSALQSNAADSNTATGSFALFFNTGGTGNTAMGASTLFANATGSNNTAVGAQALQAGGDNNAAMGFSALHNNSTGANNTAVGAGALANNTTGSNNIAIGVNAGSNIVTASDTICIGYPGVDVTDGCYIGHVFEEPLNPDNLPMAIDVNGKVGTLPSSRRFKDDIQPMDRASEAILALKPVTFHYKSDKNCSSRFGLIAEEVAEVDPDLVARDKDGKPFSVRYDQVNAMLLNEFLKDHQRVEAQEIKISQQQATITELESTVAQQQKGAEALAAQLKWQGTQIQKISAQVEINKPVSKVVANRP